MEVSGEDFEKLVHVLFVEVASALVVNIVCDRERRNISFLNRATLHEKVEHGTENGQAAIGCGLHAVVNPGRCLFFDLFLLARRKFLPPVAGRFLNA